MLRSISGWIVLLSAGLLLGSCMAWHGSGTEVASIKPVTGDQYVLTYYPGDTAEDQQMARAKHSARRYCQRRNARFDGFNSQKMSDDSGKMTWRFRCAGR